MESEPEDFSAVPDENPHQVMNDSDNVDLIYMQQEGVEEITTYARTFALG